MIKTHWLFTYILCVFLPTCASWSFKWTRLFCLGKQSHKMSHKATTENIFTAKFIYQCSLDLNNNNKKSLPLTNPFLTLRVTIFLVDFEKRTFWFTRGPKSKMPTQWLRMVAPSSAYGDAILECLAGLSTPAHVESIHFKNYIRCTVAIICNQIWARKVSCAETVCLRCPVFHVA